MGEQIGKDFILVRASELAGLVGNRPNGSRTWRYDRKANVLVRDDIGYEIDCDRLFLDDAEVLDWLAHIAEKTWGGGDLWNEQHLVDLVYALAAVVKLYRLQRAGRTRRELNEIRLRALKRDPCMDCGGVFPPEALDFDHRPGEPKINSISQMKDGSISKLTTELLKCDLVCSNCHRIRTAARRAERSTE